MKRLFLMLLITGFLALLPLAAQDFSQPKPQFLSFSLGVPVGINIDSSDLTGGGSFGFDLAVADNFSVGINVLRVGATYAMLQAAYNFTPMLGAVLSVGTASGGMAAGIGIYADLLARRSATTGIASALRLRFDYVAPTNDFGKGNLLFTTGFSFGL